MQVLQAACRSGSCFRDGHVAPCVKHNDLCPLYDERPADAGKIKLMLAGTTCVDLSLMGLKAGNAGPHSFFSDLLITQITFLIFPGASLLNIHIRRILKKTNSVFVFKHAIDTDSERDLRTSTLFQPTYLRQDDSKNTIIPGEGVALLAYASIYATNARNNP